MNFLIMNIIINQMFCSDELSSVRLMNPFDEKIATRKKVIIHFERYALLLHDQLNFIQSEPFTNMQLRLNEILKTWDGTTNDIAKHQTFVDFMKELISITENKLAIIDKRLNYAKGYLEEVNDTLKTCLMPYKPPNSYNCLFTVPLNYNSPKSINLENQRHFYELELKDWDTKKMLFSEWSKNLKIELEKMYPKRVFKTLNSIQDQLPLMIEGLQGSSKDFNTFGQELLGNVELYVKCLKEELKNML